jgi:hypothetical protein
VLYVQVTVHRDNLRINNQQDESSIQNFILSRNSTCFGLQRPHNQHETYQLPPVQLMTPDDGHRRCPKHVEFRDKIKFWILDASFWLFIRRYEEEAQAELRTKGVNYGHREVCLQ